MSDACVRAGARARVSVREREAEEMWDFSETENRPDSLWDSVRARSGYSCIPGADTWRLVSFFSGACSRLADPSATVPAQVHPRSVPLRARLSFVAPSLGQRVSGLLVCSDCSL